jgi:hypothetical protein
MAKIAAGVSPGLWHIAFRLPPKIQTTTSDIFTAYAIVLDGLIVSEWMVGLPWQMLAYPSMRANPSSYAHGHAKALVSSSDIPSTSLIYFVTFAHIRIFVVAFFHSFGLSVVVLAKSFWIPFDSVVFPKLG